MAAAGGDGNADAGRGAKLVGDTGWALGEVAGKKGKKANLAVSMEEIVMVVDETMAVREREYFEQFRGDEGEDELSADELRMLQAAMAAGTDGAWMKTLLGLPQSEALRNDDCSEQS